MRTVVIRGGWQAWAAAVVVGVAVLTLGFALGLLVLAAVVLATSFLLGARVLRALGLVGQRPVRPAAGGRAASGTIVEGEYQVVELQQVDRQVTAPRA